MKAPSGLTDVTQFAVVTDEAALARKRKITSNLTATTKLLNRADSRMPTTNSVVTKTMMSIAGMLKIAPVDDHAPALTSQLSGAEANVDGTSRPKSLAKLTK